MATANIWDTKHFHFQKESGITDIGTTAQEVCRLVTPNLPAGTYFIRYAFEADYNGTKDKPGFFQLMGTFQDAEAFSGSASANGGDKRNRLYGYPKVWAGGVMTIWLEMWKDAGVSQLDCDYVDIMVERVA